MAADGKGGEHSYENAKNKPKDMSVKIELDVEFGKIKLHLAPDYYNDMVVVTTRFNMAKSEINLIKVMPKKV